MNLKADNFEIISLKINGYPQMVDTIITIHVPCNDSNCWDFIHKNGRKELVAGNVHVILQKIND